MASQNFKTCWDLYPRKMLWRQGAMAMPTYLTYTAEWTSCATPILYCFFLHWICSIATDLAIAVMDVSLGTPYICDYLDLLWKVGLIWIHSSNVVL